MGTPSRDTIFGFSGPVAKGAAVALLMVAVTVFLFSMPEQSDSWYRSRDLIQKLYFFPLLLAAAWFGVRGATAATGAVTAVCGGLVVATPPGDIAVPIAKMGEVFVFWLVGALAANFFEQQKRYVADLETANENTLSALASALDTREHNTGLHSHRVADYTMRLAAEMGITDPHRLEVIWKGALLHDVGKIGIPDKVLLKPGPLSDEEWEVMRRHPEVGNRVLQRIAFLREPAEIVLYHHERFDGTGYPKGLSGEEIPLGARLFAVIDVYDAITTARAYHDAASHATALRFLREAAGRQFDPRVVAAFERIPFREWESIAGKSEAALHERTGR